MAREPRMDRRQATKKHPVLTFIKNAIICMFLFAGVSAGAIYASGQVTSIFNKDLQMESGQFDKIEHTRVNVLLIGSDKGGYNTDTIMLMSYDVDDNKIKILSIPRDTKVNINGKTHKINASVAYGGDALLFENVKGLTGAPINYYAKVDLAGFKRIIDILGGVEFDVPQNMKYTDPYQGLKINLKKGVQMLDGEKAEQLIRFRRYVMGDLERTKVQRDFMKALIEQKANKELIAKAPALFKEIAPYVQTNFSAPDFVANIHLIDNLVNVKGDSIEMFQLPGIPKYIDNISYVVPIVDEIKVIVDEHFKD